MKINKLAGGGIIAASLLGVSANDLKKEEPLVKLNQEAVNKKPLIQNETPGSIPLAYKTKESLRDAAFRYIKSLKKKLKQAEEQYGLSNEKYHKKFVHFEGDKNESLKGKICRAYIPPNPKEKPLYVLVLGHVEGLDFPREQSGIIDFYEKLKKDENGTVLLFRTGLAINELELILSPEKDFDYEPSIVLQNTKNILRNFIKEYNPKEIRLAGFSWGGGTIAKLAEDNSWRQKVAVKRTVMIDPIAYGIFNFGGALRKRVEFDGSLEHKNFHAYQRNDNLPFLEWLTTIRGDYPSKRIKDEDGTYKRVKDERPGDVIWRVLDTSHLEIDDRNDVRRRGYEFLIAEK